MIKQWGSVYGRIQKVMEVHALTLKLALMLFFTIINFDIMRNLKESLLVTRVGAEAIPFVKFWVVVPCAFLFLLGYSWLANHLCRTRLFIISITPFLLWMLFFSWGIYPAIDQLTPVSFCDWLARLLPEQLHIVVELVYHWPLVLFFALAELWGSGVIALLFWTTVNDLHSSTSALKSYPLIAMLGNSASIIAGPLVIVCISSNREMGAAIGWQRSMDQLTFIFLLNGLLILLLYLSCTKRWRQVDKVKGAKRVKRGKGKINQPAHVTNLPLFESIRFLMQSSSLGFIALIMLFYCICINMVEVAWKSQVVQFYSTELEYAGFMGQLTFLNGLGCLLCGFVLQRLLRKGWKRAALATPLLMAITAIPFFIAVIYNRHLHQTTGFLSYELLSMAVYLGLANNVLSKSAKYTLFDATKEMVFVPLTSEEKYKGKAAIELLVSRLGKSGSAFMQQGLIVAMGSLSLAMFWLGGIFLVAALLWLGAVGCLSQQLDSSTTGSH
ncbi:Npt1/Npt2 family nucleotide transporter [Spongorhabdus nitratireducens]